MSVLWEVQEADKDQMAVWLSEGLMSILHQSLISGRPCTRKVSSPPEKQGLEVMLGVLKLPSRYAYRERRNRSFALRSKGQYWPQ